MPVAGPPTADYPHPDLVFEVGGPLACWTRPDLKTERVSYPVPTPSGVRGVVEAVFWKPEVEVVVRRIEVLTPPRWTRITRNEVTNIVTDDWINKAQADVRHRFDAAEERDQRSSLLLRDVRYRVHFQYVLRPRATEPVAKYREQFRRRVERGACYAQPFLGTREFSASFGPATDDPPEQFSLEPFVMLHSISYGSPGDADGGARNRQKAAEETYSWFLATIHDGVLEVPEKGIMLGEPAHRRGAAQAGV